MNPYVIKPGETVYGVGFDFAERLASGETISNVQCSAGTGITVVGTSSSGTQAMAVIQVAAGQADADVDVVFTVTGSAGSVRKATREIWIRSDSE